MASTANAVSADQIGWRFTHALNFVDIMLRRTLDVCCPSISAAVVLGGGSYGCGLAGCERGIFPDIFRYLGTAACALSCSAPTPEGKHEEKGRAAFRKRGPFIWPSVGRTGHGSSVFCGSLGSAVGTAFGRFLGAALVAVFKNSTRHGVDAHFKRSAAAVDIEAVAQA